MALAVGPILVITGWILSTPMTLVFGTFETAVYGVVVWMLMIFVRRQISTYIEGSLLVGMYVILALGWSGDLCLGSIPSAGMAHFMGSLGYIYSGAKESTPVQSLPADGIEISKAWLLVCATDEKSVLYSTITLIDSSAAPIDPLLAVLAAVAKLP